MSDVPATPASDTDDLQKGLGSLVVGIADLLRLVMQRQAVRRLDTGTLTDAQLTRLNAAFFELDQQMRGVKEQFGLDPDEETTLKLGDIDGHEINVADVLDTLLGKGVVLKSDLSLELAEVPLAEASLALWLGPPEDAKL